MAVDVSFQQIQKYERGANRISASRLHLICQTLEVPPDYFFDDGLFVAEGGNVMEEMAALAATIELDESMRTLNEAFVQIKSASVRKAITTLIDKIAADYPRARQSRSRSSKAEEKRPKVEKRPSDPR